MKKGNVGISMFHLLIAFAGSILIASLFTACHVYTDEQVEVIRCPQIQDTVLIPDWEPAE